MNSYCHSGTLGDLIYGLAIVRHLGPGKFYLKLNNVDNMTRKYYGSSSNPYHQGRHTVEDFEFIRSFLEEQDYITSVEIYNNQEITHDLDRFRDLFVFWNGNYVDCYAATFAVPFEQWPTLKNTPWLTTKNTKIIDDRDIVINRTPRWIPEAGKQSQVWNQLKEQDLEDRAIFIGLPEEHRLFQQILGIKVPRHECSSMLEMAEIINGCTQFIGNQSVALSIAIGLGKDYFMESRPDKHLYQNECYFHGREGAVHF